MSKSNKLSIPCVILAGGKSSRMGRDKALLPFQSKSSLAKHLYDEMSDIFKDVHISAKENKFDFEAPLILDSSDTYAPTIALEAILQKFNGYVFIVAVDMPFVSKEVIYRLYEACDDKHIIIAKEGDKEHNMCGFYHTNLLPFLQEAIAKEHHALHKLLKTTSTTYIEIDDVRSFINVNTPSEYEKVNL